VNKGKEWPKSGGLLSPYRVLDLTDEKGLLCGKILADLGADVIKIERPGGDRARNIGPFYHNMMSPGKSLFWFAYNTNKKSVTLNIETKDGCEIFKKLVKNADFVVESSSPGYMESFNLGYPVLSKINPRMIMTSITPFGQTGPYANYKASDIVVFAMGMLMSQCGDLDRPPVQVSFPQSFLNAAADAAAAMMIAHYYRQATGEGQYIDVSAMESVLFPGGEVMPEWTFLKHDAKRPGRFHIRPNAPDRPIVWECKDGYCNFLLLAGQPGERNNKRMVEWMAEEGKATDYLKEKDWGKWDWTATTQEELNSIIEPIANFLKTTTKSQIRDEAVKRNISLYPVYNSKETVENPQLAARNFLVEIEHDELNDTITYPGPFVQFSETPINSWHRAPLIGEHNEEIYLGELGFSKDDLILLKANEII
jgi:crotonobetainyl-CoA:carnitine CoA-transferase CaiB-like acyl-CoA transferase